MCGECGDRRNFGLTRLQGGDQLVVATVGKFLADFDRIGHFTDTVDNRENGGNQSGIGLAATGAAIGQRVFRCMAEFFQTREIEEAAIALHGMDETKNGIEPRLVRRIGFPGDDLAAARFQHFPGFRDEIRQQVIHDTRPLVRSRKAMDQDG